MKVYRFICTYIYIYTIFVQYIYILYFIIIYIYIYYIVYIYIYVYVTLMTCISCLMSLYLEQDHGVPPGSWLVGHHGASAALDLKKHGWKTIGKPMGKWRFTQPGNDQQFANWKAPPFLIGKSTRNHQLIGFKGKIIGKSRDLHGKSWLVSG